MIKLFRPPALIDRVFPSFTWRLAVSDPVVFLTFDDGPHPDITPFVLDELAKDNHKATFFCVGDNLKRYPEIAERILREGHAIGNHTMRHNKGSETSDEDYLESVREFQQAYPAKLFRPPYGKLKRSQIALLKDRFQIIMWSFLTYDYDRSVSVEKIMQEAASLKPGDIIVLHDNPKIIDRQKLLLPGLLEVLEKKKLKSETIPT